MSKKTLEEKVVDQYIKDEELKKEIWKDIFLFGEKTRYQISSHGRIMNTITGRILKPGLTRGNYQNIRLQCIKNGKPYRYTSMIHRLVAQAFIPNSNPENKIEINHLDGNKSNNRAENLEWVTHEENMSHAVKNGLIAYGENASKAVHNEQEIDRICKLLSETKMYPHEISKILSIPTSIIRGIRSGKNWKHIAEKYNIPKMNFRDGENCIRATIKESDAKKICEMLISGEYSVAEISEKLGINRRIIESIRNRETWRNVSKEYNISKEDLSYFELDAKKDGIKFAESGIESVTQ